MSKYELYVGRVQPIPENIKYCFLNPAKNRILVYTDIEMPNEFVKIPLEMQSQLGAEEKRWLLQSKMTVNAKHITQNSAEYEKVLDKFIDEFERELKIEAEKAKGGETNGEKGN